jgi:hypothetical protein
VAVDQPFLAQAGLDPVAEFEEIHAFDEIGIVAVEEGMRVFRRLDRHAVAREQVEMRGAGNASTAASMAFSVACTRLHSPQPQRIRVFGEGDVGVVAQRLAHAPRNPRGARGRRNGSP